MKKIQATHLKSVAPTTANNISSGYAIGQWWENITTGDKYFHKTDGIWILLGGSGGVGTLQEVTDLGNTTTNNILFDAGVGVNLDNGSRLKEGTIDAGYGASKGISQICAVGYELKWEAGRLYVMGDGGTTIREVSHNFTTIPTATDDISLGFIVGSRWILDNGNLYICTDNTDGAAVWELQPNIPTKTSDLINDGDDGMSHFISLEDLPSNIILYPTTTASTVPGYFKLVSSITDPSYNTIAVNVPTGTITTTAQLLSSLVTSPGIIIGNPGIFNIVTIGNITRLSGTGSAEFYFEVWKRTSAGVESLITTSDVTLPVLNTGYSEFSASALWNDGVFLSTDSIVLKFYGSRISGGSDPSYQFQFGGTTPVRTLVPVPLSVVPTLTVEQLSNFNDVSYNPAIDTDSLMIKDTTNSLWKRFTIANLKELIRGTLLTGFSSSNTATVVATDTILESIGKLQGQLNNKQTWLSKDSVPTTALTGTTTITQIGPSILIPANTFSANDAIVMDSFAVIKTGTSGTLFWRLGHNTSDTIIDVNILASATLTATQITGNMQRVFEINGGLLKNRLGGTTVGFSDKTASTGAGLSISFDPTIDNYFFRLATLASATDSIVSPQILISK